MTSIEPVTLIGQRLADTMQQLEAARQRLVIINALLQDITASNELLLQEIEAMKNRLHEEQNARFEAASQPD